MAGWRIEISMIYIGPSKYLLYYWRYGSAYL